MLYTYEDDPNCQYYRDLFITIRGLWFVLWIRSKNTVLMQYTDECHPNCQY